MDYTKSGSNAFVLYRGTYYISIGDLFGRTYIKFAIKENNVNKPYYCIGNAINMKKNKKYVFTHTKKQNYRRWYKIKTSESQVISITGYGIDEYGYTLYDSNFNEINCKYSGKTNTISTRGKQPKGTYYFTIREDYLDNLLDKGYYYSLYWK